MDIGAVIGDQPIKILSSLNKFKGCRLGGKNRPCWRVLVKFFVLFDDAFNELLGEFGAIRNWHQQDTLKLPPFFVGEVKLDVEAACKLLADHQRGVTQLLDSFWC